MSKQRAFTLSEVTIVIILIGIIAVILIPFMVRTFQKEKWINTYKRTYAETYQALTLMALEEDCSKSLYCTGAFRGTLEKSTEKFGELFSSKMKVRTNCGLTKTGGICFSHKVRTLFKSTDKKQNVAETIKDSMTNNPTGGANIIWGDLDFPYTFVTARGVSYALFSFGTECLKSSESGKNESYLDFYVIRAKDTKNADFLEVADKIPENDNDNPMLNLCGFIIVDVNAEAEPNVWGKDVFGLWITDTKTLGVYPFGSASDKLFYQKCKSPGSPTNEYDGRGCAARIIEDNWAMKYLE